jgi:hypothetical protein
MVSQQWEMIYTTLRWLRPQTTTLITWVVPKIKIREYRASSREKTYAANIKISAFRANILEPRRIEYRYSSNGYSTNQTSRSDEKQIP